MATSAIPSYGSPPLTEVACGVQFGAVPLQTRHIGQFWTEIRDEYPLTQDFPPIPDVGEPPGVSVLIMPPLRRVFFATTTTEYVIQLQDSRFHHNWRKLSPTVQYPRFHAVFRKFVTAWGRFSDFVKGQGLPEPNPSRYESSRRCSCSTGRTSTLIFCQSPRRQISLGAFHCLRPKAY